MHVFTTRGTISRARGIPNTFPQRSLYRAVRMPAKPQKWDLRWLPRVILLNAFPALEVTTATASGTSVASTTQAVALQPEENFR
jgi:hypothetical protein